MQSFLCIIIMLLFLKANAQTSPDGPYIILENDLWISYYVRDGKVERKQLPANRMDTTFAVLTDQPKQAFKFRLRPGLSYESAVHKMPKKLAAISDVEGNFGPFRKLLQHAGVVDEDLNWSFREGHLVLTGDFFDRGRMVTEVLWLIYKLEWEAYEAGGHVHFILGNHETMNLSGSLRYVHPKYKKSAELMNKNLGDLYSHETELGQWLRTKNIISRVGDLLFVHAGISGKTNDLDLSVELINQIVRPYLDNDPEYLQGDSGLLLGNEGPLWYRGYYGVNSVPEIVDQTLQQFEVSKIITGHTVVADTISTHYGGKVINIDTPHASGKSEALLIEDGMYYRLTIEGNRIPLFHSKPQGAKQKKQSQ